MVSKERHKRLLELTSRGWTPEEALEYEKQHSLPDHVPGPEGKTTEQVLAKAADRMELLNERGKTHGDFSANGEIMQATKDLWRGHPGWQRLPPYAREALEMNAHKVGRILCGKWDLADHWDDIAGYAKLVSERCPK